MFEHIFASHNNYKYDTNAYTNYHNMGFTIKIKDSNVNKNNTLDLIKTMSKDFMMRPQDF
jgi:hypothetical protein